ncbi:MAG TPA: methyltransferase domain-containing protein [Actinomycetota bacterium]|jgi:tRNA (mo5U34)-methyltransferase|nr:methyltransferase domain-containing protein [Actinomycetota bacterium]
MNVDDVKSGMGAITWYHTIDLGHGLVTPGIDDTPRRVAQLELPSNLSGKTVLDIGAWDGAFSFECERRGAARVLATDSFCWSGEGWGTKDGFEFARKALHSKVEDLDVDVLELSPEVIGTFDVVLFVGVLYHMRHPLLALERVASVTEQLLILDTHVAALDFRKPAMVFYPDAELNNDSTNWWGPNPPAVEAMLGTVGFSRFERKNPSAVAGGRFTVHAWR